MKIIGRMGVTAAAAAGLVLLFNVMSAGGTDGHTAMPPAVKAPLPRPAAQPWNVEFESEMRRDIDALAQYMAVTVAPAIEGQKDAASVSVLAQGYHDRLRGCAGPAGMADYALALNDLLARAHVQFTALEVLAEREQDIPTGRDAQTRLAEYKALAEGLDAHYSRAARWLWDINNAYAAKNPDIAAQVEAQGEGELHHKAEGDSYAAGYPLSNTMPLRAPAQIFAPNAKGPVKPGVVCP